MKKQQVNEAVEGSKLIELLMQALEEGDTVRFNECANKVISYKVSECLAKHRELLAGQMIEGKQLAGVKEVHDLVKAINTDQNLEPALSDTPEEDELIPNVDLAATEVEDEQNKDFEEGNESKRLETFRERAKSKSKKSGSSGSVGY